MATHFAALPLASAAPVQIEDPDHEEDLIDDDDDELTVDDFGDDEDPGRATRYHRWLADDGSMDVCERNSW